MGWEGHTLSHLSSCKGKRENLPQPKGKEARHIISPGSHYTYRPRVHTRDTKQNNFPVVVIDVTDIDFKHNTHNYQMIKNSIYREYEVGVNKLNLF